MRPSKKKARVRSTGKEIGGNYRWVAILAQETGAGVLPAERKWYQNLHLVPTNVLISREVIALRSSGFSDSPAW